MNLNLVATVNKKAGKYMAIEGIGSLSNTCPIGLKENNAEWYKFNKMDFIHNIFNHIIEAENYTMLYDFVENKFNYTRSYLLKKCLAMEHKHNVDVVIEVPERGVATQYGRYNQGGGI